MGPMLRDLITGLITMAAGMVLLGVFIGFAVTAGTTTGIGSFSGLGSVINLAPILFAFAIIGSGVWLIVRSLRNTGS